MKFTCKLVHQTAEHFSEKAKFIESAHLQIIRIKSRRLGVNVNQEPSNNLILITSKTLFQDNSSLFYIKYNCTYEQ